MTIDELIALALSAPDEDAECRRCHGTMGRVDDTQEPTPLCHNCAQTTLLELATALRALPLEVGEDDVRTV